MKVPEDCRITTGPMRSDKSFGNNGAFIIYLSARTKAFVIASDERGWEHVSVHVESQRVQRTPTWSEMCKIKDMFWEENETVIQYHPAKSDYINTHKHTLHLWRPVGIELPKPDIFLV